METFVKPLPQLLRTWVPAEEVMVNDSCEGIASSRWRTPTALELEPLLSLRSDADSSESIKLTSLPNHLIDALWSHDFEELVQGSAERDNNNVPHIGQSSVGRVVRDFCGFIEFAEPQMSSIDVVTILATCCPPDRKPVKLVDRIHAPRAVDHHGRVLGAWLNVDSECQHLLVKRHQCGSSNNDTSVAFRIVLQPYEALLWCSDSVAIFDYFDDSEQMSISIGMIKHL